MLLAKKDLRGCQYANLFFELVYLPRPVTK